MGCSKIYYQRALQYFAHALAIDENVELARELMEEQSSERLEKFILQKKLSMSEKEFYYYAGSASHAVFNEAYDEGNDALNASCGGITNFEYLIGLEEDEESSGVDTKKKNRKTINLDKEFNWELFNKICDQYGVEFSEEYSEAMMQMEDGRIIPISQWLRGEDENIKNE